MLFRVFNEHVRDQVPVQALAEIVVECFTAPPWNETWDLPVAVGVMAEFLSAEFDLAVMSDDDVVAVGRRGEAFSLVAGYRERREVVLRVERHVDRGGARTGQRDRRRAAVQPLRRHRGGGDGPVRAAADAAGQQMFSSRS